MRKMPYTCSNGTACYPVTVFHPCVTLMSTLVHILLTCSTLPADELLFAPGLEQWTLDTRLAPTPLPPGAGYIPQYSDGFLANLEKAGADGFMWGGLDWIRGKCRCVEMV
jgi:hypothetical protein